MTTIRDLGLTIVVPFFGEAPRLPLLLDVWDSWSKDVKDHVNIIIVDDHGTPSITDLLTPSMIAERSLNLTAYRILDDLKWNTPGALNLGIMAAQTPWVFTMDSDNTLLSEPMQRLMDFEPVNTNLYRFNRLRITNHPDAIKKIRALECFYLMSKDLYLKMNGFDEDFTGEYSGGYASFDYWFIDKAKAAGYEQKMMDGYIATEWMVDVSGSPPIVRTHFEEIINRRIWRAKKRGDLPPSSKILRFNWEKVL